VKNISSTHQFSTLLLVASSFILAGCASSMNSNSSTNQVPLEVGEIHTKKFDGISNGLVGGLGLSGIQGIAPGFRDAKNPSLDELRTNTIYANYTALINQKDGQFGVVYGPKDDTKFAGTEYLAFVGKGLNKATLMVQIPKNFNQKEPCIVAAPSSGSRGVYGAIGTSGAWAIAKGCVVAYTDANKGTGAVDLSQNKGYGILHNALSLDTKEELAFRVPSTKNISETSYEYENITLPSQKQIDTFISKNPNRYAFKHAHSQKNIEKDWGLHTLQSIQFAFNQLNKNYEKKFTPKNTIVIAASVSNGGSAVLRAAEQDTNSLIDAVVASEPNINPKPSSKKFTINMGNQTPLSNHSKPAYEYWIQAELYSACATQAKELKGTILAEARGEVAPRCHSLVSAGLLKKGSLENLGTQAMEKLQEIGYLKESNKILVGYAGVDVFQSLLNNYGNAYTRSSVIDNVCNISMAAVDKNNKPTINTSFKTLSSSSNGIPRTANLVLIKNDAKGGANKQSNALSSNGQKDYNLEGALCWQDIFTNIKNPLHNRLINGINEIQATGKLQGKPTIILHGRDDAIIAINHSSRPYYALSLIEQTNKSNTFYYEVTNAQHLDTLNGLYTKNKKGGMNYVPLDYYFKTALDKMYEHLKNGSSLPPSQVVKTTVPKGALKLSDLTAIQDNPKHPIIFKNSKLFIPE